MLLPLVDVLLFGCLISAPLMYAAVDPWAQVLLALVSILVFNLAFVARPKALGRIVRSPLVWLGTGMLVVILCQLVHFPAEFIRKISPAAFAFYGRYFPGGIAANDRLTFSLYPSDTLDGLVQFLTYAFIFLTVLIRLQSSDAASEEPPHPVSLRKSCYLQLGCFMGVLSLLFHSLYDFNLHITANGMYFVTLLGLGAGAATAKDYDHEFFRRAVNVIIVFGFLVAVFAIIQKFSFNGRIYWIGMKAGSPVGPYYNYDHFAGFMELCSALAVSMVAASIFHTSFFHREGFVQKVLWFATAEANNTLRYLFMAVVMVSTIFVSTSRGGIMSFTLSMLIFFLILIWAAWRARKGRRISALIAVVCLLITVMVVWLGPEPFLKKFHFLSVQHVVKMEGPIGVRVMFYKGALDVAKDFPLTGTGFGTFGTNFMRYRTFDYTDEYLRYTHNDYLQLVTETGAAGAAFILFFLGLYGVYLGRVVRKLE
jgi:hypothetical protein